MPNQIVQALKTDLMDREPWWSFQDILERWSGPNGLGAKSEEYPTYSGVWSLMQEYPSDIRVAKKVIERMKSWKQ